MDKPRWGRMGRALGVVVTLELGLVLLTLPWTPVWGHLYWMTRWGARYPWLASFFLRGAVSGLGLVNLWTATSEITPFLR